MKQLEYAGCLLAVLMTGCEAPDTRVSLDGPAPREQNEERHRERFLRDGSPASIRWLLANRVRQGMSPDEVAGILGAPGQPVHDDQWLKSEGSLYQVGDDTLRWGPDSAGQSYFLMFRSGKLVNFDHREFRDGA